MLKKQWFAAVVLGLAGFVTLHSPLSLAQDAKDKQEAKEKKVKGRLPPYYADIVTPEQRQKIYDLQAKYAKQIADLNDQLAALERQRDTDIENVLNAEQKDRLRKAQAEAAARRKKTASDKAAGEGGDGSPTEARPAAATKKLKSK